MTDVTFSIQKTLNNANAPVNNSSSNRLTCPHCPKHKTKRYKGEEGLAHHIKTIHPEKVKEAVTGG